MSSAIPTPLSGDEIDDLLYLSRINDLHELLTTITIISKTHSRSPSDIVFAAIDQDTGNGLFHMAAGNGHTETLEGLLSMSEISPSSVSSLVNAQNAARNSPLHYAALNNHLDTVKFLVSAGADLAVANVAGRDAMGEAARADAGEVVAWLEARMESKAKSTGEKEGECEGGDGGLEEVMMEGKDGEGEG